jgi:hypothetical protein
MKGEPVIAQTNTLAQKEVTNTCDRSIIELKPPWAALKSSGQGRPKPCRKFSSRCRIIILFLPAMVIVSENESDGGVTERYGSTES